MSNGTGVEGTTFNPSAIAATGAAWLRDRTLPRTAVTPDMIRGAIAWAMAQPKCPQHVMKCLELLGKSEGMFKDVLLTDSIREVPDEVAAERAIETLAEYYNRPSAAPLIRSALGLPPLVVE